MHSDGEKLLRLMFKPGETICVSPNKYGYHSIPLENAISSSVKLIPTSDSLTKRNLSLEKGEGIEIVHSDDLILVALNPIKGYRQDANCTALRSFLVEIDTDTINNQLAYIKRLEMPYSAAIFSGNKSVHFLICLDQDLPSESIYRTISEWILGIVTVADPNTKNPSRSIRIPGAFREPGKQQTLLEYHGVVKLEDLSAWLNRYPGAKPKEKQKHTAISVPNRDWIRPWVAKILLDGIKPPNRNKKWFIVAVEFALSGFNEDDTIEYLLQFYEPERDFKQKEWENTIKSAFKFTYEKKFKGR